MRIRAGTRRGDKARIRVRRFSAVVVACFDIRRRGGSVNEGSCLRTMCAYRIMRCWFKVLITINTMLTLFHIASKTNIDAFTFNF